MKDSLPFLKAGAVIIISKKPGDLRDGANGYLDRVCRARHRAEKIHKQQFSFSCPWQSA
jgi:hypothetical protein